MPANGSAFRDMEEKWSHFKEEPHNLRIYFATDGHVNPFVDMRSFYTMWPIFLINNNVPPWLSRKREHIMLSMIIPGMCLQFFFDVVASNLSYFVVYCHIYIYFIYFSCAWFIYLNVCNNYILYVQINQVSTKLKI